MFFTLAFFKVRDGMGESASANTGGIFKSFKRKMEKCRPRKHLRNFYQIPYQTLGNSVRETLCNLFFLLKALNLFLRRCSDTMNADNRREVYGFA